MWYITNKKTQHVYYLVPQLAGHTVGRIKTDLVIQNDDSISRNHALLQPAKDGLKLTDTGSRYGTYVNDNIAKIACIRKDQPTELQRGDTVQFGRCGSVWTVGRVPFRCLTSTLAMNDKLKSMLQKLGTELLPAYTVGLSHLIMPTITVTTKLLQCLVGQVPVVNPEYFDAVNESITQFRALPSVNEFVPTCTESYIKNEPHLFHPNAARRHLFKGKEFIFFNNTQCKQFEDLIKLAGGVCLCAQREKIAKTRFVQPNAVAIKLKQFGPSQSQSQSLDSLVVHVTSFGRRMIPDVEIGLAILYGSTEKYCNPEYKFSFNVEECHEQGSGENEEVLAKNSMHSEHVDARKKVTVELLTIPETESNTEITTKTVKKDKGLPPIRSFVSPPPASVPAMVAPVKPTLERRRSKRLSQDGRLKEHELPIVRPLVSPPPAPVPTTDAPVEPTLERRRSKRLSQDGRLTEFEKKNNDKDLFQEPKRARKTPATAPSKTHNTVEEEVNIPETLSAPQSMPSPPMTSSGFLAVNRQPEETETSKAESRPKQRRPLNLLLQAEDDDVFNFEQPAPRKKPRLSAGNAASGLDKCGKTGTSRSPNEDEVDSFCFEENQPSQRRRASNRRNPRPLSATSDRDALNNNSKSSANTNSTTEPPQSVAQKRNTVNNSLSSNYREFIKPIEVSGSGWLSATMCGLKLDSDHDQQSPSVQIKDEPLDTSDFVDGYRPDDKRWISGMENIFQVREKSMNLVAHRPPSDDAEGPKRSGASSEELRNFKAFVKKRNYKVQQTIVSMKAFCVMDESQAF